MLKNSGFLPALPAQGQACAGMTIVKRFLDCAGNDSGIDCWLFEVEEGGGGGGGGLGEVFEGDGF